MLVSGNVKIELDWEQTQDIVIETLKSDYVTILKDYKELQNLPHPLEPYQKGDMDDFKSYLDAIETLLKYYMYIGDAEEFIKTANGVYN